MAFKWRASQHARPVTSACHWGAPFSVCTYPRQHPSGHEWRKPRRYESVELLPGASGVIAVDALTEWMREHRFVDFLPDFVNMLGVECVDDLQLVTVAVGVPSEGGIATASSFSPAARARPPEAGAAHGLAGGATDADHFIAAVGVAAAAGGGRLGLGRRWSLVGRSAVLGERRRA